MSLKQWLLVTWTRQFAEQNTKLRQLSSSALRALEHVERVAAGLDKNGHNSHNLRSGHPDSASLTTAFAVRQLEHAPPTSARTTLKIPQTIWLIELPSLDPLRGIATFELQDKPEELPPVDGNRSAGEAGGSDSRTPYESRMIEPLERHFKG